MQHAATVGSYGFPTKLARLWWKVAEWPLLWRMRLTDYLCAHDTLTRISSLSMGCQKCGAYWKMDSDGSGSYLSPTAYLAKYSPNHKAF